MGRSQRGGREGRRKPITIFQQLMFVLTVLVVVTTAGVSGTLYSERRQTLLAGIDDKLFRDALMAHDVLPAGYHDHITEAGSVSDAEYQSVVEGYDQLGQFMGLDFVWSLMIVDDQVVITSEASPNKQAPKGANAAFFEALANPDLYASVFTGTTPTYQIIDDKWGSVRTALVPFRDSSGRPYLLGVGVRLTEVNRQLRDVLYKCLIGGLVLFLLGLIMSLLLARLVTRRIGQLTNTIQRITMGDTGLKAEEQGAYELVALASSFNRLNGALHDKIAELAEQEENLRITLDSIGDAVVATDAEARVTGLNPVAEALTGWLATEARGQPVDAILKLINARTRQPVENPVHKVLQLGQVVGLANATALIARDGTERQIADSAAPIRDTSGQVWGVVMVFRDVTESYRIREELRQTKAFLEAALMQTPLGILIADAPGGQVRVANREAERILGVSRQELSLIRRWDQGDIPCQINHDDGTPCSVDDVPLVRVISQGEQVLNEEMWVLRPDGTRVCASVSGGPIATPDGRIIGSIIVFPDITSQKLTEESLRETQKRESIGMLAGGIAHDFNNLLTGVLTQCSLALTSLPPEAAARSRIEKAIQSVDRAADLTSKLLAYAGKGQFLVASISLNEMVQNSLGLLHTALPETTELVLDLASDLPSVDADRGYLQQIVMDLAVNAIEAIQATKGKILIRTAQYRALADAAPLGWVPTAVPAPGEYVSLEVSDTGIGMDEETRARVFDPFFSTKFTGRGLGLAAVLGIVRTMHGGLRVESQPGQGSRFTVLLPASANRTCQTPELQGSVENPAEDTQPGPAPRWVLIIDDEAAVREALSDIFELAGITALTARDGREGLQTFGQHQHEIGLVLLDLLMPAMGGEETLRRLREIDPQVPVLLSSGYDEAEVLRRLQACDVHEQPTAFLHKPYSPDEVLKQVRLLLQCFLA